MGCLEGSGVPVLYIGRTVPTQQFLEKYSNMKFHENLSSGSRVVSCGQTNRRTDMTKLTVVFRNSANEPKSSYRCYVFTVYRPTAWFLHRYASVKTKRKYHPVRCHEGPGGEGGSRGTAILFF